MKRLLKRVALAMLAFFALGYFVWYAIDLVRDLVRAIDGQLEQAGCELRRLRRERRRLRRERRLRAVTEESDE